MVINNHMIGELPIESSVANSNQQLLTYQLKLARRKRPDRDFVRLIIRLSGVLHDMWRLSATTTEKVAQPL